MRKYCDFHHLNEIQEIQVQVNMRLENWQRDIQAIDQ